MSHLVENDIRLVLQSGNRPTTEEAAGRTGAGIKANCRILSEREPTIPPHTDEDTPRVKGINMQKCFGRRGWVILLCGVTGIRIERHHGEHCRTGVEVPI